jgi:aconitate hydratase
MIARSGALADLVAAGARILESACGPCIGMGQAPVTDAVTVRSFNRNFAGRCGTASAGTYLASPEVCAAAALTGELTDPRTLGAYPAITLPAGFEVDDSMILPPAEHPETVEIMRGPNIRPVPTRGPLEDALTLRVLLHTGDNVTTDDIMPAGAKVLPLRSNIPAISEYVFSGLDPDFVRRAKEWGGGCVVGGQNYGQGSSREHAALAPRYLGVRAVLARSFARIHQANLVNFGILPLVIDEAAYAGLEVGDELRITGVREAITGGETLQVEKVSSGETFTATPVLSPRQAQVLLASGVLNFVKSQLG